MVKYINSRLTSLILKYSLYSYAIGGYSFSSNWFRLSNSLFKYYLVKPFWMGFKKILFRRFGLYTNELTKSLMLHTILKQECLIESVKVFNRCESGLGLSNENIQFYTPVSVVNFSFTKKTYNQLAYFMVYFLVSLYPTNTHFFKFSYSFLLIHKLTKLYSFQTRFFFKVYNY